LIFVFFFCCCCCRIIFPPHKKQKKKKTQEIALQREFVLEMILKNKISMSLGLQFSIQFFCWIQIILSKHSTK
jgi:hypothetical protein